MTIPLLVLIAAVAYFVYHKSATASERQLTERYARFTAQVWVGSAKYRNDPDRFLSFRDSLFEAQNIAKDEFQTFLTNHEELPEQYMQFIGLIKLYVDSIYLIEDSLVRTEPELLVDSMLFGN